MKIFVFCVFLCSPSSDQNGKFFVKGRRIQPFFMIPAQTFCEFIRGTDKEELAIVNGMSKDIIRCKAPVEDVDPFSL